MQSIQDGWAGKSLTILNGVIVFGFSATLILIPQAHWWFGAAALVSSLLTCIVLVICKKNPLVFTVSDYKLVGALILFGSVWWWSVLDNGSVPLVAEEGAHHLHLWPLLAAFFLLSMRIFTPSPHWFWLGVCCGAFGSGLVALYESVFLDLGRADNGINAIPFGNLSLLMAVLSLVAGIYYIQGRCQLYYWMALLTISAASLGFFASLLSGTRGGWVAIPFLMGLLILATEHLITPRSRNITILVVILIIAAIVAYPPSGVWLRLVAIIDDIHQYFFNNEAGNSLGMRFELWRAGWYMFKENPVMGVGEGAVQSWLNTLASEGVLYDRIIIHPQLHSDIIDTLARRGLVGFFSLVFLYVSFASAFAKKGLQANDNIRTHLLAISGLMVVIGFFSFGLSQSMFRDLRGFSGFLGFSVAIWACLASKARPTPSKHKRLLFRYPPFSIRSNWR